MDVETMEFTAVLTIRIRTYPGPDVETNLRRCIEVTEPRIGELLVIDRVDVRTLTKA